SKPPSAAVGKSHGRERGRKRLGITRSGDRQEEDRKGTTDEVSKVYRRWPKPRAARTDLCGGLFVRAVPTATGTQLETQVPPHAEDNDFAIEVSSFEQIHSGQLSAHSPIMARAKPFSAFAPEPVSLRHHR